jgi:hypothetical protein
MVRQVHFLTAGLVLGLAAAAAARADIVELTNGGSFQGQVTRQGGMVRVETETGSVLAFEEAQVREVRRGGWREEYLRRRDAQKPGDAEARYRLALWCGAKHLPAEQEAELRATLAADPAHRFARERLAALEAARAETGGSSTAIQAAPAGPPAEHQSAHVRAAADGGEALARQVAEIAEGAVEDFARRFELGADSRALARFRVAVRLYGRKSDYEEARRRAGSGGGSGFFDPRSDDCHICAGGGAGPLNIAVRQAIRHEVAHALAVRVLGIAAHRAWLAETLASLMEGAGDDGLGGGMEWSRLYVLGRGPEKVTLTVEDLLKADFSGEGTLRDYARAWSFAHFIFFGEDARKKAEMLASRREGEREAGAALAKTRKEIFLEMLADIAAGGHRADVEAIFRRHFPDQAALEAAWQEHARKLVETRLEPLLKKPAGAWRLLE